MKNISSLLYLLLILPLALPAQERAYVVRANVPLDSIRLSDPCILADAKTAMYYMTGTGGMLWKSKDLKVWDGPFQVVKTDPQSWMGPHPMIWAAELHEYKGRYYYFATFTNNAITIDTVKGTIIKRRASHILVSDHPDGPYVPMRDSIYLPANKSTLDGTFWIDTNGKPYLIYYMTFTRRASLILRAAHWTAPGYRRKRRSPRPISGIACFSGHSMVNC